MEPRTAVILQVPTETAVISPTFETVQTAGALLDQEPGVTGPLGPLEKFPVAVADCVAPIAIVGEFAATDIDVRVAVLTVMVQ